jgi:hypothetical protein
MRKSIKFLMALLAAFSLAIVGITPASAGQVGKQNFSDPYDGDGLSDIIDVQVDSYEEEPSWVNIYLAFDDIVPADLFTEDYFGVGDSYRGGIEIDTDGDGNEDYWFLTGYESLTPVGERKTIWDGAMEDTGCEAVFFGFPEEEADYVGFAIDNDCLELPETFGLNAYVYSPLDEVFDYAPDDGFYEVTNPTSGESLLTLDKTPVPTIKGTATPGSTLIASTGQWDSGVAFTFQWLRDDSPIANQTASIYKTTVSDINRSISVRVVGSKPGYQSTTLTSTRLVIKAGKLSKTPTPTVTGTTRSGSTLTAKAGSWDSGVKLTYQWLRNGVSIKGATKTSYKLTSADKGKKISVKVTGSKSGYVTVVKTSATKTISK